MEKSETAEVAPTFLTVHTFTKVKVILNYRMEGGYILHISVSIIYACFERLFHMTHLKDVWSGLKLLYVNIVIILRLSPK